MKVFIGRYPKNEDERTVRVRIDPHDIWSLDHTLALIIHPALIAMREDKLGAPAVDNEDVPEAMRVANPEKWEVDESWFPRWQHVLDEMIWAFGEVLREWDREDQFDIEQERARAERIENGLRLFGKYYRALWT